MTPGTVAHQAPLSLGFSRQEYWSGLPFLSPENLPNPGIESGSPALQADSLLSELILIILVSCSYFSQSKSRDSCLFAFNSEILGMNWSSFVTISTVSWGDPVFGSPPETYLIGEQRSKGAATEEGRKGYRADTKHRGVKV